jgi:hypothetical protein
MSNGARRVVLACVLGGARLAGGFAVSPQPALASCDPAYFNYCVPPVSEVGDLNCQYFYDQGISNIQLADPNNDPHGLDVWNRVGDGIGCEGY